MVPTSKIEELISKHSLLEKELSSGKTEKKKFAEKSKEYSELNDIINQGCTKPTLFGSNGVDLSSII